MRKSYQGGALAGVALLAGLSVAGISSAPARANVLVRDDGATLLIRPTTKGAVGVLRRVRRNSVEGRRALWFAAQSARRQDRAPLTVASTGPNSKCLAVRHFTVKGSPGPMLPGQKLIRCAGQPLCAAPLCSADMTCAGSAA